MLKLSNCLLKDIDESTKDLILKWRNQDHVREWMFSQEIISKESHYVWIESLKNNPQKYAKVFFYNNVPMGLVTFSSVGDHMGIYEWGFYIGEKNAPKGMGTLLGIKAIDMYFLNTDHHKLFAEVLDYNKRSIAFHEKLSFKREGILRKHYKIKNEFFDTFIFGLLKNEWQTSRNSLLKKLGEK